MRGRTLVIYILILVCLAAYYYYFEIYSPMVDDMKNQEPAALFNLKVSDVEEISITGTDTIKLSKKGSLWRITDPVDKPADSREIEDLLAAVLRLKSLRTLEDTPSLADLGLDPPGLLLDFKAKEEEFLLYIGNPTPTKQYCYALLGSTQEVFLINAYEKTGLNKDVFALRDKHIFSVDYGDITKINIRRHGLIMQYHKGEDGFWHLSEDQAAKLKTEKINELLATLCRTQARSFPDEPAVSGDPDIIIELFKDDGSEILKIWLVPHTLENIFAYSEALGQFVEIRDSLLSLIPHDSFDVMDRSILFLDAGKVEKIVLAGKDKRVFTKKGGIWFSGEKRLEEGSNVDTLLETMGTLEYEDEYMRLPEDVFLTRSIQISYQDSSSVFDIGLYSQYYVSLGDTFYQINEGGMKMINDSIDVLTRKVMSKDL